MATTRMLNHKFGTNKMFLLRVIDVILIWSFYPFGIYLAECSCRQALFTRVTGSYLETELLSTHHVNSLSGCGQQSLAEGTCVGFKYRPSHDNEPNCKSFKKMKKCSKCAAAGSNDAWEYYKAVESKQTSKCSKNRFCKNDGKCVDNPCDKEDGFNCICPANFSGKFCENVIGNFSSCQSLHHTGRDVPNGVYNIQNNGGTVVTKTYCQMTSLKGCTGGGWTMVMKIDGNLPTFEFNATYWSNKVSYNQIGGTSGFDDVETKLQSYWITSFTEICVGMKVGNDLRFLAIPHAGQSLHSLLAEGKFIATNVSRANWKSLIANSSLQPGCNHEGFNIYDPDYDHMAARIGIIGDELEDCDMADSFIGLGGKYNISGQCYPGIKNSPVSGNLASCGADAGNVNIKSMGYILVR